MTAYAWLKKIPSDYINLDDNPLLGSPPPFDWIKLSHELASVFQIPDLKIEPEGMEWKPAESSMKPLEFIFPSLEGNAYWMMSEGDISKLMSLLLSPEKNHLDVVDEGFKDGFYQFLGLEVIHALSKTNLDSKLIPQLVRGSNQPNEPMLTQDITLSFKNKTVHGRLLISQTLRKSIKELFLRKNHQSSLAENIELTLHVEAGNVSFTKKEWSKIKTGDFIFVPNCSLKAGKDGGPVSLTLRGQPFFLAKIKDGNIKLLEHPLYHEVNQPMNDEDFEEDEFEEDEEDIFEDDEEFEEEEEEEEEEELEEEIPPPPPVAKLVPESEKKKTHSPEDIPMNVVIEVARINMSVKTLMGLQPGNLLELNIHPESGVDLVVNGTRIAKGELLQIGETLGVRILEL